MTPAEQDQEMLGQTLKGLLAGFGVGNGLSKRAIPVRVPVIAGHDRLLSDELVAACATMRDGDVLVVASKIVALSEGRFFTSEDAPPRLSAATMDELRAAVRAGGYAGDDRDLIMLDHIADSAIWTVSVADPNTSAAALADQLRRTSGVRLDVVLSDSGAGVAKGRALIGCVTYVATPIGATAGLTLVQAQRCAAAGETVRNAHDRCPYVLLASELDPRRRHRVGEPRYPGYLDAAREDPSTIPPS